MSLVCLKDFEEKAAEVLSKANYECVAHGAAHCTTLKLNRKCFQSLRLLPKCLRDVSSINIATNILGSNVSIPIGIAPTAFQKISHPDGELATVRAAEKAGVVYIQSTVSTASIEEVAGAAPNAIKWFQLYVFRDRSISERLIRRAEKSGFKAIVVTVDSPTTPQGVVYSMTRNKFHIPEHLRLPHLEGPEIQRTSFRESLDSSLGWDGIKWLVEFTKLPIIAKGVLRAEDALKAVEAGCKAVIVSNHGGRLVDTVPATIQVLPEIVQAVGGKVPVLMDGGVTLGTDVIKALGLGAQMVFLGRPIHWGLAVNGQSGVEEVLKIIREEFETTMTLCGVPSLKDITPDLVSHESQYKYM